MSDLRRWLDRVVDLNHAYAACLDARQLAAWPDFFTADCLYRIQSTEDHEAGRAHAAIYCDGRDMLVDRATTVEKVLFHQPRRQRRHVTGVRIVSEADGRIRACANFMLTEAFVDAPLAITMAGRYLDTIVEVDGQLKFFERLCVYDNHHIDRSIIYPV